MQIRVRKEVNDALGFVRYKNNVKATYQYKLLKFGATFLPSCAVHVLQKSSIDNQHVSNETSQSKMKNFYKEEFQDNKRSNRTDNMHEKQ